MRPGASVSSSASPLDRKLGRWVLLGALGAGATLLWLRSFRRRKQLPPAVEQHKQPVVEDKKEELSQLVITKDRCQTTFTSGVPTMMLAESGSVVEFHTNDGAYEKLSRGEHVELEYINVVTGPLYVQEAEPGDLLRIEVMRIDIDRAWMVWDADAKLGGCLAAKRAAMGQKQAQVKSLQLTQLPDGSGWVQVSERLRLPLEPMIGCIATCPESHKTHEFGCGCSTFEPTYPHGGNMDLREISVGSTIWLPVNVPGGQLYVGDLHACMARGEAAWVGFEAAGKVQLRVHVEKLNLPLQPTTPQYPIIRTPTDLVFTSVADTHENAMQAALGRCFDHLVGVMKLTPEEAFCLCVAKAEARFGGPASTLVLVAIPADLSPFLTPAN